MQPKSNTGLTSVGKIYQNQNSNPKKQLIIEAFRTRDARMLEVLLNDGQAYSDVPKDLFLERYTEYFNHIQQFPETKLGFSVFPGHCTNCHEGKKGFSFVNPDGECFLSLVFEESEDDYFDIRSCTSFKTEGIEVINTWIAPYFYTDEKVGWKPDSINYAEMAECDRALKELNGEIEQEGILIARFYLPWYHKYEKFADIANLFNGKYYKYSKEVRNYLSAIRPYIDYYTNDLVSQYKLCEFQNISVIRPETVIPWLLECREIYKNGFATFAHDSNYLQDYFEYRGLKFLLSEIYFTHAVYDLMNRYWHWLPAKRETLDIESE